MKYQFVFLLMLIGCTADRAGLSQAPGMDAQVDLDVVLVPDAELDVALDLPAKDTGVDQAVDATADVDRPDVTSGCPPPIVEWDFAGAVSPVPNNIVGALPNVAVNTRTENITAEGMVFSGPQGAPLRVINSNMLTDALKASGSFTVHMQVQSLRDDIIGPARIFTSSENTSTRNFSVMQFESQLWVRLRTSTTNDNGTRPIGAVNGDDVLTLRSGDVFGSSNSLDVTVIFDATGAISVAQLYIGNELAETRDYGMANINNWGNYEWGFGDEWGDVRRGWEGVVHNTRIWNQALSVTQIRRCVN